MTSYFAEFPTYRPRRLRRTVWMQNLVRETKLTPADLIWPIFLIEGENKIEAIPSMPGIDRLTVDRAILAAQEAKNLGIPVLALFPYIDPALKSAGCEEAYNPDNLINRATRAIKAAVPDIGILLDVALDPYNTFGHDGLVKDDSVENDATLEVLARQALAQAEAGADILGPSDMMDGRIGTIRRTLDDNGFPDVALMAYSAKYASAFYGPFRDAVGAAGALAGDKSTYQMDPGNGNEALCMIARDLREGADMAMVKPGQAYLDVCARAVDTFNVPIFAYQVSGEYAMIEAADQKGWINRDRVIMESLMAFKRAGCTGILTYYAYEVAKRLQNNC